MIKVLSRRNSYIFYGCLLTTLLFTFIIIHIVPAFLYTVRYSIILQGLSSKAMPVRKVEAKEKEDTLHHFKERITHVHPTTMKNVSEELTTDMNSPKTPHSQSAQDYSPHPTTETHFQNSLETPYSLERATVPSFENIKQGGPQRRLMEIEVKQLLKNIQNYEKDLKKLNTEVNTLIHDVRAPRPTTVRPSLKKPHLQKNNGSCHNGPFGSHSKWHGNASHKPSSLPIKEDNSSSESLKKIIEFPSQYLQFPAVFQFLPNLLRSPLSISPSICYSRYRHGMNLAIGIPTVKRNIKNYLIPSLKNIIDNLSETDKKEVVIVVMIGETSMKYVNQFLIDITTHFEADIGSGLLEIISPHPTYYPDLGTLKQTLGDTKERVKWRTKQNLDYAYLMTYARPKAKYYLQLEDDIEVRRNFYSYIKKEYPSADASDNWVVLDFCKLGFIGKMFRSSDLPIMIQFLIMFHNEKPGDWLLFHLLWIKSCNPETSELLCKKNLWDRCVSKTTLFQHVGTFSSLPGKKQNLKDTGFTNQPKSVPPIHHKQPRVKMIICQWKALRSYTFGRFYKGKSAFWGHPKSGKYVLLIFEKPFILKEFRIVSGDIDHPHNILTDATIEVHPVEIPKEKNLWKWTKDGYLLIGEMDALGKAEGRPDVGIGEIDMLRILAHADNHPWALIKEMYLEQLPTTTMWTSFFKTIQTPSATF